MSDISIPVSSWNRFAIRNLRIDLSLVGAQHEFTYGGCKARIQLPSSKNLSKEPLEGEVLSFDTYRDSNGEKIPSNVRVHAVDIEISRGEEILVTDGIMNQAPNAYDVVPRSQQEQLDALAEAHASIAEKAFNLWTRILRWKSGDSGVGRPEVIGHESGWGTYLVAESTRKRIWNFSQPDIVWIGQTVVTADIWNTAERAVWLGLEPPIFIELMFDAIEHIRLGDLQRAAVDLAVACECYIRKLVANSLPNGLKKSLSEYVDDANVRIVLTKFIPDVLSDQERRELKRLESRLHKLFDIRNEILHTGRSPALDFIDCGMFLEATRSLINIRN
jgi:hypothetical protein